MKAFILSTSLFVVCTVLQALDFASTKKLAESGNATATIRPRHIEAISQSNDIYANLPFQVNE